MQVLQWITGAWTTLASLTPILNVIPFFNGQWINDILTFFFRG